MTELEVLRSSFRDPSGFVFRRGSRLFRQVNRIFGPHYDHLIGSGLYKELADDELLVSHDEVDDGQALTQDAYKVLAPEALSFISYPYEWSFSELRDAALTTLRIQRRALDFNMTLRDASAYNIQFHKGRPILIDTLSFEILPEGRPWVAYRQFCQHFLAPLALMAYGDPRMSQLLRVHIDGVPLDLAASLLPARARLRASLLIHIFSHAKAQSRYSTGHRRAQTPRRQFSPRAFRGLIDSLERAVLRLGLKSRSSAWIGYDAEASHYSREAVEHKRQLVEELLDTVQPRSVWDLGANVGAFSRIPAARGIDTVSFDLDPMCVDENYRRARAEGNRHLLPLVLDLTSPSPSLGWANRERASLSERGPADVALALALIHHLAIGNNVPLDQIAAYLRELCHWLVLEFVPKDDPKVEEMLSSREDVFANYTQDGFESSFGRFFAIERREKLAHSKRVVYLLRGR